MSEYWLGVLTPFIVIGGIGLLALVFALVVWLWSRIDWHLMARTDLAPDLRSFNDPADKPRTHVTAANKIPNALLESPRLYSIYGLGWIVVLVRNSRQKDAK